MFSKALNGQGKISFNGTPAICCLQTNAFNLDQFEISVTLTTQFRLLTTLKSKTSENIVPKRETFPFSPQHLQASIINNIFLVTCTL